MTMLQHPHLQFKILNLKVMLTNGLTMMMQDLSNFQWKVKNKFPIIYI